MIRKIGVFVDEAFSTWIVCCRFKKLHDICWGIHLFPPASIRHLVGTVEHSHQGLLIIDARERDDNGRVRDDQIQVVFGEVKVGCLKSQF